MGLNSARFSIDQSSMHFRTLSQGFRPILNQPRWKDNSVCSRVSPLLFISCFIYVYLSYIKHILVMDYFFTYSNNDVIGGLCSFFCFPIFDDLTIILYGHFFLAASLIFTFPFWWFYRHFLLATSLLPHFPLFDGFIVIFYLFLPCCLVIASLLPRYGLFFHMLIFSFIVIFSFLLCCCFLAASLFFPCCFINFPFFFVASLFFHYFSLGFITALLFFPCCLINFHFQWIVC